MVSKLDYSIKTWPTAALWIWPWIKSSAGFRLCSHVARMDNTKTRLIGKPHGEKPSDSKHLSLISSVPKTLPVEMSIGPSVRYNCHSMKSVIWNATDFLRYLLHSFISTPTACNCSRYFINMTQMETNGTRSRVTPRQHVCQWASLMTGTCKPAKY